MKREDKEKKIKETIKKLQTIIEATGVKNVDMHSIREATYQRRHKHLNKMRDFIQSVKEVGGDKAMARAWLEQYDGQHITADGGDIGLGKVEYCWNRFVSMYFRYANPRNADDPQPIRGKLTGTFRGLNDFIAWLNSSEMRYSGFWQGVIKDFANTFFGVINGAYAKLWVPETTNLTVTLNGIQYTIPEVTAEYLTDNPSDGTRPIEAAFGFKHICWNRETKHWCNPAPYPHNAIFEDSAAGVIYSINRFSCLWGNITHNYYTDDFYWEEENNKAITTQQLNSWEFANSEDFMWNQVNYTDDITASTEDMDYNHLSTFSMNIVGPGDLDPNAANTYTATVTPLYEQTTFGYDIARGKCQFRNFFDVLNFAKTGWPEPQAGYVIVALATGRLAPRTEIAWGQDWHKWCGPDNNDRKPCIADLPLCYSIETTFFTYKFYGIKTEDWIGWQPQTSETSIDFNTFRVFRSLYNCTEEVAQIPTGSCRMSFKNTAQYTSEYHNYLENMEVRPCQNPGTFSEAQNGYKDYTYMIVAPPNESLYKEAYIIKKQGTVIANYDVLVNVPTEKFRYWMIGFSYTRLGEHLDTRYKYFNEDDNAQGQQWNWTTMSQVVTLEVNIDIPVGTLQHEIFIFCNQQSSECEREQDLYQKVTINPIIVGPPDKQTATIRWKIRTRQPTNNTRTRRFSYYILWPKDRPNPNPGPTKGIFHPTSDNEHDPYEEYKPPRKMSSYEAKKKEEKGEGE